MPLDDAIGCLAEGCLTGLIDGLFNRLFPRRALRRQVEASRSDLPTTPVGCGARLIALALWGVILTAIVVTVYLLLFGWGAPPPLPG